MEHAQTETVPAVVKLEPRHRRPHPGDAPVRAVVKPGGPDAPPGSFGWFARANAAKGKGGLK